MKEKEMNRLRTFLYPIGKYHRSYDEYIRWSFISNVISSTEYALATHSMLHAIDTGSETTRTANYIGKDIIGQLGGIGYMAKMGERVDKQPSRFLLHSNIIQQVSLASMCITPFAPSYFLPIAGCSNILSNISYIGFGAINAKCIQRLAIDNNTGEVYAKITTINTLASSIGLLIGLSITVIIPDHGLRLLIIPFLAFGRVYTFNRAISNLIT